MNDSGRSGRSRDGHSAQNASGPAGQAGPRVGSARGAISAGVSPAIVPAAGGAPTGALGSAASGAADGGGAAAAASGRVYNAPRDVVNTASRGNAADIDPDSVAGSVGGVQRAGGGRRRQRGAHGRDGDDAGAVSVRPIEEVGALRQKDLRKLFTQLMIGTVEPVFERRCHAHKDFHPKQQACARCPVIACIRCS